MARFLESLKQHLRIGAYDKGAGVVEYSLALGLLTAAVIAMTKFLGTDAGTLFRTVLGWF